MYIHLYESEFLFVFHINFTKKVPPHELVSAR